jgi:hypothetical protein
MTLGVGQVLEEGQVQVFLFRVNLLLVDYFFFFSNSNSNSNNKHLSVLSLLRLLTSLIIPLRQNPVPHFHSLFRKTDLAEPTQEQKTVIMLTEQALQRRFQSKVTEVVVVRRRR